MATGGVQVSQLPQLGGWSVIITGRLLDNAEKSASHQLFILFGCLFSSVTQMCGNAFKKKVALLGNECNKWSKSKKVRSPLFVNVLKRMFAQAFVCLSSLTTI